MDFSQISPEQLESLSAKMNGTIPGPSMNRFKTNSSNAAPLSEFASGKAPEMVDIPLPRMDVMKDVPMTSNIIKNTNIPDIANDPNNAILNETEALKRRIAELEASQNIVAPKIVSPVVSENQSLKEKIAKLEVESGRTNYLMPTSSTQSYKSETGEDTYYVKNISNGHVTLNGNKQGDPDVVVRLGEVLDLLKYMNYDELVKWHDLRSAVHSTTNPTLKRITEIEYFNIMQQKQEMSMKVKAAEQQDAIKRMQMQQNNPMGQNNPMQNPRPNMDFSEPKIRTAVMVQLNNLELAKSPDPEKNKFGSTNMAFIEWMMREMLTQEELDFLLTQPILADKHDIKAAIISKKNMI